MIYHHIKQQSHTFLAGATAQFDQFGFTAKARIYRPEIVNPVAMIGLLFEKALAAIGKKRA